MPGEEAPTIIEKVPGSKDPFPMLNCLYPKFRKELAIYINNPLTDSADSTDFIYLAAHL